MANEEVKAGDIVTLKSESIKMTVGAFESRGTFGVTAICYWYDIASKELKSMSIYVAALKVVSS